MVFLKARESKAESGYKFHVSSIYLQNGSHKILGPEDTVLEESVLPHMHTFPVKPSPCGFQLVGPS